MSRTWPARGGVVGVLCCSAVLFVGVGALVAAALHRLTAHTMRSSAVGAGVSGRILASLRLVAVGRRALAVAKGAFPAWLVVVAVGIERARAGVDKLLRDV